MFRSNEIKSIILIALTLLLAFNISNVSAANVSLIAINPNAANIYFEGKIVRGDYKKVSNTISRFKGVIVAMELDSLGGDVEEAIKISKLIENLRISTIVVKNKVCGSACFFIFIGGSNRMAAGIEDKSNSNIPVGFVGIHRPFLADTSSAKYISKQENVMRKVRDYLDNNLIPRKISDAMISRPSNDVYWLTYQDLYDLGEYPPAVEEHLISTCNYDRNAYLNKNKTNESDHVNKMNTVQDCIANLWLENYEKMKLKI